MKRILHLDEDDIRFLLAEKYNVPLNNVTTIITEEPQGYREEMTPVFYAEVELEGDQ